jgi:hypothetical protein
MIKFPALRTGQKFPALRTGHMAIGVGRRQFISARNSLLGVKRPRADPYDVGVSAIAEFDAVPARDRSRYGNGLREVSHRSSV